MQVREVKILRRTRRVDQPPRNGDRIKLGVKYSQETWSRPILPKLIRRIAVEGMTLRRGLEPALQREQLDQPLIDKPFPGTNFC